MTTQSNQPWTISDRDERKLRRRRARVGVLAWTALGVSAALVAAMSTSPVAASTSGPESLYSTTSTPAARLVTDAGGVTLGTKIRFAVAGSVSGIQAYRPKNSPATRVALWAANGAKLATGKLPAGSGWLVAPLKTAVPVAAGTTYVASMFEVGLHYTVAGGSASSRTVGDLAAPTDAGVFTIGSTMSLPTTTYGNDYLVSPQFTPSSSAGSGGSGGSGSGGGTTTPPTGKCASSVVNAVDGPDPWGGCWPGPASTGVPAGTKLKVINGDVTYSTPGQVVSGVDVKGNVTVRAPNVTFENSVVEGGQVDYEGVSDAGRLLVQDVTIDCLDINGATGAGEFYATFLRVDVSRCVNGFDADKNLTVKDSYIHDLCQDNDAEQGPCPGAHTDGLQSCCGAYLDLEHNVFYAKTLGTKIGDLDGTSAINVNAQPSSGEVSHDTTIKRNLLAGGAYSLYCPGNNRSSNYQVTENVFSRVFDPKVASFGPTIDCNGAGISFTGNLYATPGQAAAGAVPSTS